MYMYTSVYLHILYVNTEAPAPGKEHPGATNVQLIKEVTYRQHHLFTIKMLQLFAS